MLVSPATPRLPLRANTEAVQGNHLEVTSSLGVGVSQPPVLILELAVLGLQGPVGGDLGAVESRVLQENEVGARCVRSCL